MTDIKTVQALRDAAVDAMETLDPAGDELWLRLERATSDADALIVQMQRDAVQPVMRRGCPSCGILNGHSPGCLAEHKYHAALQRIGYALGLLPGSDLLRECVPAIEALRKLRTQSDTERDALWCVNVWGPDDVYAMPSKAAALERANEMNIVFGKIPRHEYDPIMLAVVIEWPHDAESHASNLARQCAAMGNQSAGKERP